MTEPNETEPPPRCPKHLDNPTEQPCRPCGQARVAHAHWEALQRYAEIEDED